MPENRITAAADATDVLRMPSIVSASLGTRTSAAKVLPVNLWQSRQMAHRSACRLGLGYVAHRAAEAAAFDLHLDPPCSLTLSAQRPNERRPYIVSALWPRPTEFYTLGVSLEGAKHFSVEKKGPSGP
jgi:hypothetical protein